MWLPGGSTQGHFLGELLQSFYCKIKCQFYLYKTFHKEQQKLFRLLNIKALFHILDEEMVNSDKSRFSIMLKNQEH